MLAMSSIKGYSFVKICKDEARSAVGVILLCVKRIVLRLNYALWI